MPAEWYPHKCCWMLVPFRTDNWRQNAQPAQHAFINVAQAISRFEKVMLGVHPSIKESFSTIFAERQTSMEGMGFGIELFDVEYDDCWMRDVGATFLHNSNHNSEGTSPATNLNECDASMEPVLSKIAAAHSPVVAMDWIFNAWGRKYSVWENDDKVARAIVNYNNLKEWIDIRNLINSVHIIEKYKIENFSKNFVVVLISFSGNYNQLRIALKQSDLDFDINNKKVNYCSGNCKDGFGMYFYSNGDIYFGFFSKMKFWIFQFFDVLLLLY
mgnify:CR=1 FL=1